MAGWDKRGQIKGRISIDTRPTIVAERTRLGDWEVDTVEGSKGGPVLVTLAERKSRLFLVGKAPNKSASEVQRVIERLLAPIRDFVHTVTYDNGKEFSYHTEVSATLNAQGFFAHPLPLVGTRPERELQWATPPILPQEGVLGIGHTG